MFQYIPIGGHTQQGSLSSVKAITVPVGASGILIQATGQNVRITLDNTPPTPTRGFQLKASDPTLFLAASPSTVIQAIEEQASATIDWQAVYSSQFGAPVRQG